MMKYLDIDAIRLSLVDVQQSFSYINLQLSVRRQAPSCEVIENLLAGYAKIDSYLSNDYNLLEFGNSRALLELNQIVLFSGVNIEDNELSKQFQATKQHFYETENGGVGGLMEWLKINNQAQIFKKVAGVFCYIVAQPQLFIEGNHRVATLVASYMLMKEGYGPLVVTMENAQTFFEIAEKMKERHKNSLFDEYLSLPRITNQFALMLEENQTDRFLQKTSIVENH